MKILKKNWWKVITIVNVCVFLDLILHALVSLIQGINTPIVNKPCTSVFAKSGLLLPSLFIYELIAFGILAIIFMFIQYDLIGKKWIKGLLYGASLGGLYFVGMFEVILLWNDTLVNSILTGISDFVPILLMGMLLGICTGTDKIQNRRNQTLSPIFIIATFYIMGRYFAYFVLRIESAYNIKPLATFIWTLFNGLWIGIIYFILQLGVKGRSAISKGLFFGIVIFGLNWLLYNFFIPIMYNVSIVDTFIRVVIDALSITVGVYSCKKLFDKSY